MLTAERVVVVDDSPLLRSMITQALDALPGITVIGQAGSGREGLRQIEVLDPDIVSLDIELGDISGLEVLEEVMRTKPRRVVVVSSQTEAGADTTLRALALGAVDFVAKGRLDPGPDGFEARLAHAFEAARHARVLPSRRRSERSAPPQRPRSAEERLADARERRTAARRRQRSGGSDADATRAGSATATPARRRDTRLHKPELLLIASSTGGPPALQEFFSTLTVPPAMPTLIVQHMPEAFTSRLAARLDLAGPASVSEAAEGDRLRPGHVHLAKGGRHLGISGGRLSLLDTPPIGALKPRADVTFEQAVEVHGSKLLAVVLTGMGDDGLVGCRAVVQAGGQVLAQSAETSTVDGMPQKVRNAGLHLDEGSPTYLAALIDRLSGGRATMPADAGRRS
ncbi:MAG: chemotaxis-specific protein-glutamate methyltransferase CheB [Actinomycetota bacterium]